MHAPLLLLMIGALASLPAADLLALAGAKPVVANRHLAVRAWLTREIVDAYRERGVRDPKWDADAERVLCWLVAHLNGDPEPMHRRTVADTVKRLQGKGVNCHDPMVAYAGFRAMIPERWLWYQAGDTRVVNPFCDRGNRDLESHGVFNGKRRYFDLPDFDLVRWYTFTWSYHEQKPDRRATADAGARRVATAAAELMRSAPAEAEEFVLRQVAWPRLHGADQMVVWAEAQRELADTPDATPALQRLACVTEQLTVSQTICWSLSDAVWQLDADRQALLAQWRERAAAALTAMQRPEFSAAMDGWAAPDDWDDDAGFVRSPLGRCLPHEFDQRLVYANHLRILAEVAVSAQPVDYRRLLAFGADCAATKRFDTEVPWQFVEACGMVCRTPAKVQVDIATTLAPHLDAVLAVLDAYAKADPARADWCACARAALLARAGKTAEATAALASVPEERWVRGVEWTFGVRLEKIRDPAWNPPKAEPKPEKPKVPQSDPAPAP